MLSPHWVSQTHELLKICGGQVNFKFLFPFRKRDSMIRVTNARYERHVQASHHLKINAVWPLTVLIQVNIGQMLLIYSLSIYIRNILKFLFLFYFI